MRSIISALAFLVFTLPSVLASGGKSEAAADLHDFPSCCQNPKELSTSYIGLNKDVKATTYSCGNVGNGTIGANVTSPEARSLEDDDSLGKRGSGGGQYTNVCGATCKCSLETSHSPFYSPLSCPGDTHCFNPAGGGPDPNECHVISDALRYNSQNIANIFNIPRSAAVVKMQYKSCYSFWVNQATVDLQYCRQDWVSS